MKVLTFEAAAERFWDVLAAQRASDRTVELYLSTLQRLNREFRGKLVEATAEQLKAWRSGLAKQFERDKISAAKVRLDVTVMKRFFRALATTELSYEAIAPLRPDDPAATLANVPRMQWQPRPMPQAEVDRLFDAVAPKRRPDGRYDLLRLRDRAMFSLYLNGVRNTEVCMIDTSHLRYAADRRTLILTVQGKGQACRGPKIADLPLAHDVAENVALYSLEYFARDSWKAWVEAARAAEPPLEAGQRSQVMFVAMHRLLRTLAGKDYPLFVARQARMTRREANRRFAYWRRVAGLPKYQAGRGQLKEFGPHSLRHSCATFLLDAGVDSLVVRDIMRHNSVVTTQNYVGIGSALKTRGVMHLTVPTWEGGLP